MTFANYLCLNLSATFAHELASQSTYGICKQPFSQSTCDGDLHIRKQPFSQSTCDGDLHIRKQLVSQALQAIVSSSAFCKQLMSQDPYVIVTTYNLQLTTLMHVQNMLHNIKAPRIAQLEPSHNQF
jgi:hypothetical protein